MATAVYMITDWAQLTTELAQYRIGIVNPAIDWKKLGEVAPNLTPFASFNMTMLSQAGPDNPYYQKMRERLDPFVMRHQPSGAGASGGSGAPIYSSEYHEPYFDFTDLVGADRYAEWMRESLPWQPKYLDDCTETLPDHKAQDIPESQREIQVSAFPKWRDRVITWLTSYPQDPAVVINCGGWICDKVNGICIEKSHRDKMGKLMALSRYVIQSNLGRKPIFNIDWAGEWEFGMFRIFRGVTLPGFE